MSAREAVRHAAPALLALVVLVPFLVAIVDAAGSGWEIPNADLARIELRTADVGTTDTPLVGPYSRYGWNHPGPWLFSVLAVPYRVFGGPVGLLVGALVVNAVAVGVVIAGAYRRGGLPLLSLASVVVLALMRALGPAGLRDPWNPSVTVLPFLAFLVLVWVTLDGDAWALPVAALAGSFCVTAHVGFALPIAGVLVAGAALVAIDRRRLQPAARWRNPAIAASGVTVLLWAPTLVEQAFGTGNVSTIVKFFAAARPVSGLAAGVNAMALQLGPSPPWLDGSEPLVPFVGTLDTRAVFPVGLVVLVLAVGVAIRWRLRSAVGGLVVAGSVLVASAVALARVTDELWPWLARFSWATGPMVVMAVCWTFWCSVAGDSRRAVARVAVPVLGALAGALGVVVAANQVGGDVVGTSLDAQMQELADDAATSLSGVEGPVLVESAAPGGGIFASDGFGLPNLVLALERAGVRTVVPAELGHIYGPRRALPDDARTTTRIAQDDQIDDLLAQGWDVVVESDPLGPAGRAERARLEAVVEAALAGANDPSAFERAFLDRDLQRALERLGQLGEERLAVLAREVE